MNFWETLPRPFFVLAPMADVTDAAFRRVIAKYGKPDVTWTEFVSADGLALAPEEGRKKLLRDLIFDESERPIVAQFFTSSPENMEKAARIARELGFDGIDINMGCPADAIEKQGAGAKLITTPECAREVIRAAKRGAGELPVSVKTRLGYNKDVLEEWLPVLLEEEPAAITLHARTRKEMSKVDAHWERVKRAVEIRNEKGSKTLILGNGDAKDIEDAKKKAQVSRADGVMLGRAIFGNPWLFSKERIVGPQQYPVAEPATSEDVAQAFHVVSIAQVSSRLRVLVEHTKLFEELLGDIKSFAIMKKHFKAYVEGFDGAKELRVKLMESINASEVENIIEEFLTHSS